jgi:hypothetical protein
MQYYCRDAADRFGNIQNNRSTSFARCDKSSLGDALDCAAICLESPLARIEYVPFHQPASSP